MTVGDVAEDLLGFFQGCVELILEWFGKAIREEFHCIAKPFAGNPDLVQFLVTVRGCSRCVEVLDQPLELTYRQLAEMAEMFTFRRFFEMIEQFLSNIFKAPTMIGRGLNE